MKFNILPLGVSIEYKKKFKVSFNTNYDKSRNSTCTTQYMMKKINTQKVEFLLLKEGGIYPPP